MAQGDRRRGREKVSADRTREELIFAVLSMPAEFDERLTTLIGTLNDLPDVYTVSSCGGHPDQEGRENAVPEGYFYVQFIAEPTEKGFLSFGIIDLAARSLGPDRLAVQVLNTTDSPRLVMFHILGRDNVDPDAVAREIQALCRRWGVSLKGVREYKRTVRKEMAFERMRKEQI